MEIFKTDILKKEFEKFQKENLVQILECCYSRKTACEYFHRKSLVSFKFCRETFCKSCHNFNIANEMLFKGLDQTRKEYTKNFIKDFLGISNETLQRNYKVEVEHIPVEKTFNVKIYHKSDKNRNQVVYKKFNNCEKISYSVKGKNRIFHKKF